MPVNQRGDAGLVLQRYIEHIAEAELQPLLAIRTQKDEGLGRPAVDLDLARPDHQPSGSLGSGTTAPGQRRGQAGRACADQEISAIQHGAPRSFRRDAGGTCPLHLL
jgi:hypothetical protein